MSANNKKQISIVVIAAVLTTAFIFGRYLPVKSSLASVRQQSQLQRDAIAEATAKCDRLDQTRNQLAELEARTSSFSSNVPNDRLLGDFLQDIAGLMSDLGLEDQVVAPGSEIESNSVTCVPITMKCRGTLDRIFSFYKSLRDMPRLVRIEEVRLTGEKDSSGQVNMETRAVIFYRGSATTNKSMGGNYDK